LQIKGARVASEIDAKRIVLKSYINKMRSNVSATEGPTVFAIVRLGFDVPGFAAKGDEIWEARVIELVGGYELRAVLWVNPNTEKVHFVIGPWIGEMPK
jgi:hypothetical protein